MLEIAICDDDRRELEIISGMVHEICSELKRECRITGYQQPGELLDGEQKIDIGILDIVMPDCDGIELGRKLKERFPGIRLIYATSYEDYYSQAINKVHAFSYLVKPIKKPELKEQILECIRQELSGKGQGTEIVFENIRDGRGEVLESARLSVEDILYCEYVKTKREIAVILRDEVYYYREVFDKLAERLKPLGFAINCRGSIVNLLHIRRLKGYSIYLDNGEELQLTQKRVAKFKEQLNAYIHKNERSL